jgi:endonuclease G
MTKKKKTKLSFLSFKSSWISALLAGVTIGIASQRIPQVRAYTDEVIQPIKHQLPIEHYYIANSISPGKPLSSFQLDRSGYSLAYDAKNRNPLWVYEHLTADNIRGNTDRSHFDFKEDESFPNHLRATLADYRGQGFDRGHLAPAANHRLNDEAMADTFYMSNMCPQCPQFNRGYWSKLEKYVRDLTKEYHQVHVITGPLYLPYTDSDGKRYVKYQVIGENDVAVPTHFFKVITLDNGNGYTETQAYILPNQAIESKTPLEQFKTTIQKVEKVAGILFPNS